MVVDVNDSNFEEEVLRSEIPVLLDLWAEWCEPCRQVGLAVEKLAPEYAGRLKMCRMDVAANPRTVAHYHVSNLPTLLFIRGGAVVGQHTGGARPSVLSEKIAGHLGLNAG